MSAHPPGDSMAEFIEEEKKIVLKIVYYGPALSGKTTNLMRLHDLISQETRGDLMTFETRGDRTLFFDLLPMVLQSDSGYTVKIKLYTVPGQVSHDATRKAVLSRADGVVFVADSQDTQAINNAESFENLEKNAGRVGLDFNTLPLVIQFNKRDLPNTTSETDILDRWQPTGLPVVFSSAVNGEGVRETFESSLSATYRQLDNRYELNRRFGFTETDFLQMI